MAKNTRSAAAADPRLDAAEKEAGKIVERAIEEAARLRAEARADAAHSRAQAEELARAMVLDARATADGVRAEGMELVSSLRQMGDALRGTAERLQHDIESIHARMVSELERAAPGAMAESAADSATGSGPGDARAADGATAPGPGDARTADSGQLDVPDFVARR